MYTLVTTGDVPGASSYFNPLLQQTIIPCTSGARPSSPTDGMTVYETDTRFFRSWNSADSSWYIVGTNRKLWVIKLTDTGRPSNSSPTSDPELFVANVPASTYYHLNSVVSYNADTAADIQGGIYGPSGATFKGTYQGAYTTATSSPAPLTLNSGALGSSFGFGGVGTGTDVYAVFDGIFYSGSGGTMGFTWAQAFSNAIASTVKAQSYIRLVPLG